MSGQISGSVTIGELSASSEGAWGQRDHRPNEELLRQRSRNPCWLPDIPSPPSFRGRVADCAFVLFLLVARCSFLLGVVVGGTASGFLGAVVGLAGGWLVGRWTGWSLGLRRRRLTHGFVVRMLERGNNDRPKLLESVVETLRGQRFSARQCRLIAAAYAVASRQLQSCVSPGDRASILQERDRKLFEAAYGRKLPLAPAARATL